MRKKEALLGSLILVIVLSMAAYMATADQAESRAAVANVSPNVIAVTLEDDVASPADEIDLVEGTTKTVHCDARVKDPNGWTDIVVTNATIYDDSSSLGAADDNNAHYTNSSCGVSMGSGIEAAVNCTFEVWYYANATTWTCNLRVADQADLTDNGTDTSVVQSLVALDMPGVIDFGTLQVGTPSATDVAQNINNTGNQNMDINLDGYGVVDGDGLSMNCTDGTNPGIPLENIRYNISDTGDGYSTMTALTDTAFTETAFDLLQRFDDLSPSTQNTYWKFNVSGGAAGTCNGTVNIAAILG